MPCLFLKIANINLLKLESRPVKDSPGDEMFYLDFEGNLSEGDVQDLLDELTRHTRFIKVLGCYPSEEIVKTELSPQQLLKTRSDKQEQPVAETPIASKPSKASSSYRLASREHKDAASVIEVKGIKIGAGHFTVIAGPCSVESREQILECAKHAREHGAQILRGGCFKPRTSPYSFQGHWV